MHIPQALLLAQQSIYLSDPNPRVGCVLVAQDGNIIGTGYTQRVGGPHAEVMALRDAAAQGKSTTGAAAYVTLEPCSHFGRTPPCCNALIDAKVAKVIVALLDPNPLVAGKGVNMLRAAGIAVEVLPPTHPQAIASRELNIGFMTRMERKTPWVRVKMAAALDGITALPNGASQWITGEAARADGHAWRARASAVLTGVGTVLADDPMLDVRHIATQRQPHLVIVDSQLRTPCHARLFATKNIANNQANTPVTGINGTKNSLKDGMRSIYIYTLSTDATKKSALELCGATVIVSPDVTNTGRVDLSAMLHDLAQREVNELHVEAGATLNGALLAAGLVDECLVYLAPKLLGAGRGLVDFATLTDLNDAMQLEFNSVEKIGDDLRLLARVKGRDKF